MAAALLGLSSSPGSPTLLQNPKSECGPKPRDCWEWEHSPAVAQLMVNLELQLPGSAQPTYPTPTQQAQQQLNQWIQHGKSKTEHSSVQKLFNS